MLKILKPLSDLFTKLGDRRAADARLGSRNTCFTLRC